MNKKPFKRIKRLSKSVLNLNSPLNNLKRSGSQSVLDEIKFNPNRSQNNETDDHKSNGTYDAYNYDEGWGSDEFDVGNEETNDQKSSDQYNVNKSEAHINDADNESSKHLGLNHLTSVEQAPRKFECNSQIFNSIGVAPTASYDVTSKPIIKSKPQVSKNKPMIFPKPFVQKSLPQPISPIQRRPHIREIGSRSDAVLHFSQGLLHVSKDNSYSYQPVRGPDITEATNCGDNDVYYSIPYNSDLNYPQTLAQNTKKGAPKPLILTSSIFETKNNMKSVICELKSRKDTISKDANRLAKYSVGDLQAPGVLKQKPFNHLSGSTKEENNFEKVLALYSYEARSSQELSFKENDTITVLDKEDSNWWRGQVGLNGAIGLFPLNYVQNVSTHYDVDGSIVSHKEYTRQKLIKEFIDSEDDYVRDIEIIMQVFQTPLSKFLTDTEMHMIFGNLSQLLDCNRKFLRSLYVRRREVAEAPNRGTTLYEISDIFCSHFQNMFVAYKQFCTKQLTASILIQRKSDSDPRFREMVKSCSLDMRANGLSLNSYLLKPMQRMTKYPLLIKKILDHTPKNHPDYSWCQKAIKMAENLCSNVNTECDTQENIKRLEWCQTQIQCDSLDYTIIFNSETNCLGPRKLLHSASLGKRDIISKQLMGFLFNDFLLLAVPLDYTETTSQLFKCDKAMASKYTVYKHPIMLNDIKEVSHFDAKFDPLRFKILLKSSNSFVHLKATSENDVSLWMKMIDSAAKFYGNVEDSLQESNSLSIITHNSLEERGCLQLRILKGVQLSQRNAVLNALCELSIGSSGNTGEQTYKTKNILCVASSTEELSTKNPLKLLKNTLITSKNKRHSIAQCGQVKHNLFTAVWNESILFPIYDDISDELLLTIKFFDLNPYAPRSLQGWYSIPVSELTQVRHTSGPVVKEIKLTPADNKVLFLSVQLEFEALHMYSFI